LEQAASCTACGLALPAAASAGFGGTLVMPAQGATPPPAVPEKPHGTAPLNLKGTMIGLAPPTFVPTQRTEAPAPPPTSGDSQPPAASPPTRAFSGTMIGMAPPGMPSEPPPAAPAPPADAGGGGAPRLASAHKTMLGVARPGIAPLNPGQVKSTPPPGPRAYSTVPSWPPPPAQALSDAPVSSRPRPQRRISITATLVMVVAAMLLATAVIAFVMLRGRGSVSARASLDGKGREVLELSCAECLDGTKTWIDSSPVSFRNGKAALPLSTPLKVGENPLVIVLERPGRSREEIALSIPIEFRVRGSTDELAQESPKISVVASTLQGTKLEVDGKPVSPEPSGAMRFDYDVVGALTGPEPTVKTLERSVPYKATSASGNVQDGRVEIRIGITPLIVDAPGTSIVVGSPEVVLAGRTAPGAVLKIGTDSVSLDPEGRFVSKKALQPGDNKFVVRSTLKDHAPRLVEVSVRRSDNLDRDATQARATAQTTYADVLKTGEGAIGRSVALEGELFDLRHDGYSSVLLVDVRKGCRKGPCLAKVIYGVQTQLEKGRDIKAFGKVVRFVDGPRTGQRIPEIRADLVAAGAP
ncbi:MAG TPA: hypothetical protein VEX18_16025, partial [Polyangiaceae bacterium]|nr:hypothetical protein [Polyangiaceae bacterium]